MPNNATRRGDKATKVGVKRVAKGGARSKLPSLQRVDARAGHPARQGRNGKSGQHKTTRKANPNRSTLTVKEVTKKAVKRVSSERVKVKRVKVKKAVKGSPAALSNASISTRSVKLSVKGIVAISILAATAKKSGAVKKDGGGVLESVFRDKVFLPNHGGFGAHESSNISGFLINARGCNDKKMYEISQLAGLNSQLHKPDIVDLEFPVLKVATGSNAYPQHAIGTKSLVDGRKVVADPSQLKALGFKSSVRRGANSGEFIQGVTVDVSDQKAIIGNPNLFRLHADLNKLAAIGVGDIVINPENIIQHVATGNYSFPDLDAFYRPNINNLKYQVEQYTGRFCGDKIYDGKFMAESLEVLQGFIIDIKGFISSSKWQKVKERKLEIFSQDLWESEDHMDGFDDVEEYVDDLSTKLPEIKKAIEQISALKGEGSHRDIDVIIKSLRGHVEPFERVGNYGSYASVFISYCVIDGFHVENDTRDGKEGSEMIFATIRDLNQGYSRQYKRIIDKVHPESPEADIALRFAGPEHSIAIVPITILPRYMQDGILRLQDLTKKQKSAISGGSVDYTQEPEVAADPSVAIANDDSCAATKSDKPSPKVALEDVAYISGSDGKIARV